MHGFVRLPRPADRRAGGAGGDRGPVLTRGEVHWRWTLVATWSGLRGALAMTLALSLPASVHSRELLIRLTFGVVLLTLLVQGLTLRPMVRALRLGKG